MTTMPPRKGGADRRIAARRGAVQRDFDNVISEVEILRRLSPDEIWVYGVGGDGVAAFTDFGVENVVEFIKMHKVRIPRQSGQGLNEFAPPA